LPELSIQVGTKSKTWSAIYALRDGYLDIGTGWILAAKWPCKAAFAFTEDSAGSIRDTGRVTGKQEVRSYPFRGSVPIKALVLTDLANIRVVGKREVGQKRGSRRSLAISPNGTSGPE
jgi:hypothetical protein